MAFIVYNISILLFKYWKYVAQKVLANNDLNIGLDCNISQSRDHMPASIRAILHSSENK